MIDPKPPCVFLSYSRPDRARVAKLAEALKDDVPDGSFRAQRRIPRTT